MAKTHRGKNSTTQKRSQQNTRNGKRCTHNHSSNQSKQKYHLAQKSFATVKEEIKQNIKATSAKLRRYTQRINQCKINKTFATTNEGQLYKQFENKQQANLAVTEEMTTEIRNFWTNIWGDSVTHNSSAKLINDIQATTNTYKLTLPFQQMMLHSNLKAQPTGKLPDKTTYMHTG